MEGQQTSEGALNLAFSLIPQMCLYMFYVFTVLLSAVKSNVIIIITDIIIIKIFEMINSSIITVIATLFTYYH